MVFQFTWQGLLVMQWNDYFTHKPCTRGWNDFVIQMEESVSFENMDFDYFHTPDLWWAFEFLIDDKHALLVKIELERRFSGKNISFYTHTQFIFPRWERLT